MKTLLAILGIIAATTGASVLNSTDAELTLGVAPTEIWIDGKPYTFTFTDDNTDETLIIKTDRSTYDGISKADVYFVVSNETDQTQDVDINFLFGDNGKKVVNVQKLNVVETVIPIYKEVCVEIIASSTEPYSECTFEVDRTETRQVSSLQTPIELLTFTNERISELVQRGKLKPKDTAGYVTSNTIPDTIEANGFALYHAEVSFANAGSFDKFYIEAFGSKGAYGHLDPWFSSSWLYRKAITLTGVTGAGTGNVVLLKVGESSGATGEEFDLGSHSGDFPNANDDGGDLRFTDNDGSTELSFYVERVTGTTPNRLAWVWVEVADDLGSNTDIYVYYGNAGASNSSSGVNTFALFDDFNDASIDASLWNTKCSSGCHTTDFTSSGIAETGGLLQFTDAAVANSQATLTGDNSIITDTTPGFLTHFKLSRNDTGTFANTEIGYGPSGDEMTYTNFGNDTSMYGCNFADVLIVTDVDITNGVNYITEMRREGSSELEGNSYTDSDGAMRGTDRQDQTRSGACTSAWPIYVRSADGADMRFDYIFASKWADGVVFNTAGTEEQDCLTNECTTLFTTPGYQEWVVPSNVTELDVSCWGGGGGGADGATNQGGGGGGGGAFASSTLSTSPGSTIRIMVGDSVAMETTGATSSASTTAPAFIVEVQGGQTTSDSIGASGGLAASSQGTTKRNGGDGGTGETGTGDESGGGGGAAGPHAIGGAGEPQQGTTGGAGGQGDGSSGGTGGARGDGGSGGIGTDDADGGGGGGGADDGTSSVGGAGGAPGGGGGGGEGGGGTGARGQCMIVYQEDAPVAGATPTAQTEFFFE